MEERINEIVRLIDTQLAIVPDNPIEESYKARTLASYVQALNGLLPDPDFPIINTGVAIVIPPCHTLHTCCPQRSANLRYLS